MDVRIYPPEEMIEATVKVPLSKSMSNRALIMNALTPGASPLAEVADCDDTKALVSALQLIGVKPKGAEINVGPAGTAMRFLTAYIAAQPGIEAVIDGSERMRQRPIGPLVGALRKCGAEIEFTGEEGYPPLQIKGRQLHGGKMEIDASISSQFISALLMVAPTFDSPLEIVLKGQIASLPYLKMTLEMMVRRGIKAELYGATINVEPGIYLTTEEKIERDWSAASYWYELTAVSAGWLVLEEMSLPSLQGDSETAKIFEKLGVITESAEDEDGSPADGLALNPSPEVFSRLDLDLSDTPDLVQTLAVTCCLLGVPFKFTGVESLRIKETDRLAALKAELAKLSFDVQIESNSVLSWQMQRTRVESVAPIDTHGDHRMAMAFAPAAVFLPGLAIRNADVVSKSYPAFWDDMRNAGFTIQEL